MLRTAVLVGGVLLGLAAVRAGVGLPVDLAIGNLIAGWSLIGAGLLLGAQGRASRIDKLLIAAGITWFLADLVPWAAFLHRGPLIHLLVSYPNERLTSQRPALVVVGAYGLGVATGFGVFSVTWTVLAVGLVAFGLWTLIRTRGAVRRARAASILGSVLLGGVLLIGAVPRMLGAPIDHVALLGYDLALVTIGMLVTVDRSWRRRDELVTGFIVDLGRAAGGATIQDRLARAVGDPELRIAFCAGEDCTRFVDELGGTAVVPAPGPTIAVTPLVVGGRQVGVLIHDPIVLRDPRSLELLAGAARLAVTNAELQRSIRDRLEETSRSRTRLVQAADEQRRRIEAAIRSGPAERLDRAKQALAEALQQEGSSAELDALIEDLGRAREELLDFARGVHPSVLREQGVGPAVADLAHRLGCPAKIEASTVRFEPAVESTIYFIAAEGLANAVKYARASRVHVDLRQDGSELVLRIADDGIGGASLGSGGGLRGLTDRIEALGGHLVIDSRAGAGTTIEATLDARRDRRRQPALAPAT